MDPDATVRANIDPDLKSEVEDLFKSLGLSVAEAITLFYRQVKLEQGLPFEVSIPNEVTEKTFKDTDAGKNVVRCSSANEMFELLDL